MGNRYRIFKNVIAYQTYRSGFPLIEDLLQTRDEDVDSSLPFPKQQIFLFVVGVCRRKEKQSQCASADTKTWK